eukprot:4709435-Pleurochrysis_carterae.AAC.2
MRDDGVTAITPSTGCFWYKPNSSHKHLYPAKKNEFGQPVKSIPSTARPCTQCALRALKLLGPSDHMAIV